VQPKRPHRTHGDSRRAGRDRQAKPRDRRVTPPAGDEVYQAIFEQSIDSIVILSEDGWVLDLNAAAHEKLGYTREELLQLHLSDIDAKESAEQAREHMAAVLRAGSCRFETQHRTKGGELRDVSVKGKVISTRGKSLFLSVWSDVTEENRDRQALEQKNAALQELLAQVQQAKVDVGQQVRANVERLILPTLHDLQRELPPEHHKRLAVLFKAVEEITSPFGRALVRNGGHLSPAEIRICQFIRCGLSTKAIAELQHISPATVNKHRENIRRKIGIRGKDVNLLSHLNSVLDEGAQA